jgi:membrane-bound ClpP family serine protease
MVPLWKRLLYSLVSVFTLPCLLGVVLLIADHYTDHSGWFGGSPSFSVVLGILLLAAASVCAWLLILPIVLWTGEVQTRFWQLLGLGALIGPALNLLLVMRLHRPGQPLFVHWSVGLTADAALSGFMTLIYLLLVRRSAASASTDGAAQPAEGE